ncbi:MAG: Uma2 family endonuclease [Pseudomonadota bacterium]
MNPALLKPLTEDDYLTGEAQASVRHEFVHGAVYAMAGGSANHNRIADHLYARLLSGAEGGCEPFIGDMKLRLDAGNLFYYPDVMLVCDPLDNEAYFKTSPCLVAEVLSPSTESTDRREKWAAYQKLPSLREYILLAQDRPYIEVYKRVNLRQWSLTVLEAADTLVLSGGNLSISLQDLYRGVDFSQAA